LRRSSAPINPLSCVSGFRTLLGAVMVRWYDHNGFNRPDPELLAYVSGSVQQYKSRNAAPRQQDSETAGKQTELDHDG
jgi:hypothetical protein